MPMALWCIFSAVIVGADKVNLICATGNQNWCEVSNMELRAMAGWSFQAAGLQLAPWWTINAVVNKVMEKTIPESTPSGGL